MGNRDLLSKSMIEKLVHSLSLYLMIAIVLGARVFHVAFYDGFDQLFDFNHLVNFRDGGLASHGAVFFILVGYKIWAVRKKKLIAALRLSDKKIFDLVCLSSLINAWFIRLGNFINQEILGKPTDSIFGITFLNPIHSLEIIKRHPVQLYEGFFYLVLFIALSFVYYKMKWLQKEGTLTGIFFVILFSFRFFIESFKEAQGIYDQSQFMMGELLSVPCILFGIAYYLSSSFQDGSQKLLSEKKE